MKNQPRKLNTEKQIIQTIKNEVSPNELWPDVTQKLHRCNFIDLSTSISKENKQFTQLKNFKRLSSLAENEKEKLPTYPPSP